MMGYADKASQTQASIATALAGIRADFLDGLFPLINELEYQQSALADPGRRPQALESIQRIAHKISGMAGSVGFSHLGDHAAEIDMGLRKLRFDRFDQTGVPGLQARLETFMDLMEEALDAVS